jgi:hypothetical protein
MSEKAAKKATVERVAELAMRLGGRHLADYGSTRGRHDFAQRQLMACLILRAYLKTTYRGVLELLSVSPNLLEALGMQDKLPHYTTLQKFSARSRVLAIAGAMIRTIGRAGRSMRRPRRRWTRRDWRRRRPAPIFKAVRGGLGANG